MCVTTEWVRHSSDVSPIKSLEAGEELVLLVLPKKDGDRT